MSAVADPARRERRPAPRDPHRPDEHLDATRRPDYEALAHREGPVPESAAWNVLSYLLAGLIGFGLPAWLLDRWLGTTWIVLVGILAGTAVAMLTIWVRYGTGAEVDGTRTDDESGPSRDPRRDTPHDAPDASPLEDTP